MLWTSAGEGSAATATAHATNGSVSLLTYRYVVGAREI
jgi:hypothetical protein